MCFYIYNYPASTIGMKGDMSETLLILEKINTLYSGAIAQLITYTIGVLAFVGILVPTLIGILQSRQLTADHKILSALITSEIALAKAGLDADVELLHQENELKLKELIEATTKEIRAEILKSEKASVARSLHLQANTEHDTNPVGACSDALKALICYSESGNESNIPAVLNIFEACISKCVGEDLKNLEVNDLEVKVKEAVAALKQINDSGRYNRDIQSLQVAITQAKARKPAIITA